jgi:[acyl-carrier-protein] S-malonyltransferase
MQPAADEFINHLQAINWQQPQIPVIHNYDVTSHNDAASICSSLVKQLYHPVRWVDTIEYFVQQGVNTIVECGPGQILTGLLKRIAPQLRQEQGAVVC